MRIAMLEVSHWHASMYLDAVRDMPECALVAVSDKRGELARLRAQEYGCRAYTSSEELLDEEEPDFVFIFGEHAEMVGLISMAVDRGIPFCVEKPAGLCASELKPLAERVRSEGLFNAVCYVYRMTPLAELLLRWREEGKTGRFTNCRFKYVTGPPSRYVDWRCEWMLDPERSGGGTTINLSVHYVDLLRYLTGEEVVEAAGQFSDQVFKEKIEDHSVLLLRTSGGTIGQVETGYTGAGCPEDRDHFELMTEEREMVFEGREGRLRWWDRDGRRGEEVLPRVEPRAEFVRRTLKALSEGGRPPADLDDAVAVLEVLDMAGYRRKR